jgi:hypothetical protein
MAYICIDNNTLLIDTGYYVIKEQKDNKDESNLSTTPLSYLSIQIR